MKKYFLLIFTLALFCVVSQAMAQQRLSDWVAALEEDPPATLEHHKRVAFIFSQTHVYDPDEEEFVYDKNIAYRVGNFIQVKSALERFGNFDAIGVLVGPDLNKANVKNAFQAIVDETNPGDEIFIYWESHGATDKDGLFPEHGSEEADSHNEFLILGIPSKDEVITDDEFADLLFMLKGRRVMLLMEACHSGGMLTAEAQGRTFNKNSFLFDRDDSDSFSEQLEDLCGNYDYTSLVPLLDNIITENPAANHISLNEFSKKGKSRFFRNMSKHFKTKDIGVDHPDLSVIFSSGETEASYCALVNTNREVIVYNLNENRWLAVKKDVEDALPVGAPVFALVVALSDTSGKYSHGSHTDFKDVWNIVKDLVPANCGRINSNRPSVEPRTSQTPQYMDNTGPIDIRPAN